MKKKFLALVMTLSMALSLVPMTALAAEGGSTEQPLMTAEGATGGETGGTTGSETGGATGGETGGATGGETGGATGGETGGTTGGETGGTTGGETGGETSSTPANAAKIGTTEYASIADAIATADGSEPIVLLRDVTENITIGKSLTLDLAGFTLTGADEEDAENAVVTITGSDETKPTVTIKSSKIEEEKHVNGTITGGRNPQNGGGFAIDSAVVRLEDLTITDNETVGGNGNGEVGGGGIYALHADVSMQNVTVSENSVTGSSSDGGGILVRYGSLTMDGCHVEGNTAPDCGGGMLLRHSVLNAAKSFFENNTAKFGAGIYFGDTPNEAEEGCSGEHNHLITDSTISGNTVLDPENGIGGGMYVGTTSNLTLRNSKLLNNDGATQGGAIVAYSAGTIELDGVSISENKAQSGAGILALCTAVCNTDIRLLNGTAIDANTATGYGGGIYANAIAKELNVTVTDSSVSGNTAAGGAGIFTYKSGSAVINVDLQSGAVMHNNNAMTNMGGAIYAYNDANINIAANSAVYNNTAKTAGDDLLLNGATFTLPKASEMSGNKQFKISDEENGTVTGWFYDGWFKWDPNAPSASGEAETKGAYVEAARWSMDKADEYTPVENDTVSIALKAATKKAPSPGGGGGGGSHKPTVTIPDDVPTGLNGKDHYAYVVGYPDGMVYPQKNITRAEVATIFFRLLTDETREANMTKSNSYNDMKDGAWYTCAVSTLSKMGIIKGYEDGSFKPDASISRAEFAAIAARFDPDGDKTPATFSDVSSHWAKDEISIAANHGWIKGYEDGSFKPDQKITRAETMTLVNRVLKRLPETKDDLHKDMKTWPDNQNESAWFYLAVQEATNSHYQNLKKDGTHEKWESMRETRDWAALEK